MKTITEKNEFTVIVPLLEKGDPVKGGEDETSNQQAKALEYQRHYL